MATETTNYNLTKPADDDLYDIADFNDNMEIIDTSMAQIATQTDGFSGTLDQIVAYIGEPNEEGETLFNHYEEPVETFYQASDNFKYGYDFGDTPASFSSNGNVLMQFTAKHNGTVSFLLNSNGDTAYYIYIFDVHQWNYFNVPSMSVASAKTNTVGDNFMARRTETLTASEKGFVVPVIAGHKYLLVSENSIKVYSAKIGYDLVSSNDLVETDVPAIVEEEE